MERGRDRPGLVRPAELGDVGAGGEDPLATGDHDRAREVGGQLVGGLAQLAQQRARQRVDLAVGQRDDRDAVVAPVEGEQSAIAPVSSTRRAGSGPVVAAFRFRRGREHPWAVCEPCSQLMCRPARRRRRRPRPAGSASIGGSSAGCSATASSSQPSPGCSPPAGHRLDVPTPGRWRRRCVAGVTAVSHGTAARLHGLAGFESTTTHRRHRRAGAPTRTRRPRRRRAPQPGRPRRATSRRSTGSRC